MPINLTPAQYSLISLNATPGASKRLTAACSPGAGDSIDLAVGQDNLSVLQAVNAADLADAATRCRWSTLRTGALYAAPMEAPGAQAPETAADAPGEPQDGKVGEAGRVTKGAQVLALLMRPAGATNAEMMEATGWQTHSVRGFLAGKQLKATGYRAERFTRDDGAAAYRAVALRDVTLDL